MVRLTPQSMVFDLYADDEESGQRDEAGGDADDVDAAVSHPLADAVFGKDDAP